MKTIKENTNTVQNVLALLMNKGFESCVAFPVSELNGYEEVYFDREQIHHLSEFEPDYRQEDILKAYLAPWETIIGLSIPYALLPINQETSKETISQISIMAWEWDYHEVIKKMIKEALGDEFPYQIHVDMGPLPERSIALQMGMGKAGRNQFLIHPMYGTAFHLAFILISFSLKPAADNLEQPELIKNTKSKSFELANACKNCRICQLGCPAKALTGESNFNGQRCISALTQKKGYLEHFEKKLMGVHLYGCDYCQLCCPVNRPLLKIEEAKGLLLTREKSNAIDPAELLSLSGKRFKNDFGHMGFSWRGIKTNKRNALINMANDRSEYWIPKIEHYLRNQALHDGEDLIETAKWAIEQIKLNQ